LYISLKFGNAQAPGGLRGLQTRCASTGVEVGGFDSHTFPRQKADSFGFFYWLLNSRYLFQTETKFKTNLLR